MNDLFFGKVQPFLGFRKPQVGFALCLCGKEINQTGRIEFLVWQWQNSCVHHQHEVN